MFSEEAQSAPEYYAGPSSVLSLSKGPREGRAIAYYGKTPRVEMSLDLHP